jgi:hypothetical protein
LNVIAFNGEKILSIDMMIIFFSNLDLERERRKRKKVDSRVIMGTLEEYERIFFEKIHSLVKDIRAG